MPELPEVETVRRELMKNVLKKRIQSVKIYEENILRGDRKSFKKQLVNSQFVNIVRIGKLLQFHLNTDQVMLAHLKMTGHFIYQENKKIKAGIYPLLYASSPGGIKTVAHFKEHQHEKAKKHLHVLIRFQDGSSLSFRDQRKFGYLQICDKNSLQNIQKTYGIDPLQENFTLEAFKKAFSGRTKSVKAILMDQQLIAGIGNIYADEICHRVGIRPHKSVKRISKKMLSALYNATNDIIQQAVKNKGTTFKDFTRPDGEKGDYLFHLQVYGRSGLPCQRCETGMIEKVSYLGRGTHFCSSCQA